MQARFIQLDETTMNNTGGQYGIVSTMRVGNFNEPFISVKDLIDELQLRSAADAEVIAEDNLAQEHPVDIDMKVVSARWRAINDLVRELRQMIQ